MGLPLIFLLMKRRGFVVLAGLLAMVAWGLAGCSTTEYVPVERVEWRDSVRVVERKDSVYVRDSVWVNQWHDRDTTWVEKVTTHTVCRDRWRVDTIMVERRDSVPYAVPVTKEVVKYQLRWWQRPLVWLGGVALVALALLLLRWYVRKRMGV